MSWWNELITTFRRIIQALKTAMIILVMKMNLMLNCLSESNSMKHLLTVYLFKNEKYLLLCLPQFCSEVGSKTKYLVWIALFRKQLVYILKKVSKWKNYDQSQKLCYAIQLKIKNRASSLEVWQLTIEFKCTVLQLKLISYTVADK